MYVITNRELKEEAIGLKIFGKKTNPEGPNELRLLKVTPNSAKKYHVELYENELTPKEAQKLINKHKLNLDPNRKWYKSLEVACKLYEQARREKKNILLYVHGYNNDMGDVLATSAELEKTYNVVVLIFSWPANGGGIEGYPAYLSDKRDARASADALNRTIQKIQFFHSKLTDGFRKKFQETANARNADNPTAAQIEFTRLLDSECQTSLNLVCHSMGNYLLKYALQPSSSEARSLVFDNITLVAADANNKEHAKWVESLQCRNRLYIVINENDFALKWSRRKPGDEQLARLGHYLKNLVARNATYLNVTEAAWVKNDHGYFVGTPVTKNKALNNLFTSALEGGVSESSMRYRSEGNYYELR